MNAYSPWPYFASMALLLLFGWHPILRYADSPPNPRGPRLSAFDGLRGFLALAVFFHHGATFHKKLAEGVWEIPPSETFYLLLGKFGVAGFFMITGYLFWSRAIRARGRIDWRELYIGRVFRIGPLYMAAAAVGLVLVLIDTGPHLNVPLAKFLRQFTRWLSLGLLKGYDLNGSDRIGNVLSAAWTLQFEWYFYISLPLLALVSARTYLNFYGCAGALSCTLVYIACGTSESIFYTGLTYAEPIALFLVGMTCAAARNAGATIRIGEPLASSLVAILLILAVVADPFVHDAGEIVLLGWAFYLIAEGCSLFGLLTSRPACRLGNISYGIYLLQFIAFEMVYSTSAARDFAVASGPGHWALVFVSALLLIAMATAAHVWIERPFMDLGKRLAGVFARERVR